MSNTQIIPTVESIEPDVSPDQIVALVADVYTAAESKVRLAKEQLEAAKVRIIAWMEANGQTRMSWKSGPDSDRVLFLDFDKSVKCFDVRKTVQTLVELEGDWEAAMNCLSSSAIKHGEARKYLVRCGKPELFDELFETVVKTKLKDGTPAPKQLQDFDTKFIR